MARVRSKAAWANSFNEVQKCEGDLNIEANWHAALAFNGGKVDLTLGVTARTASAWLAA